MNTFIDDISLKNNRTRESSIFSGALALYFCLISFDFFSVGSVGTILKLFAVVLIGAAFIYIANAKLIADGAFWGECIFLLICVLSVVYSIKQSTSWSMMITLILNYAMLMVCSLVPCSAWEVRTLKNALVSGSVIAAVLTFAFSDFSERGRLSITILDDTADQNYLNGYLFFALGFFICSAIKTKKYRIIKLLFCVGILYFTLLTGSRGALLAEVAMILTALFISVVKSGKKGKYIVLAVFGCLIFFLAFTYLLSVLPEEVAQRFSLEFLREENGSVRIEIWKALLNRFFGDNFFRIMFGQGIGTSGIYNPYDYHVAHNVFIDILVGTGIIGVSAYTAIYALMFKKAWKSENYPMVVILVGFLVMCMSLSLIAYKPIFNAFLFIEIFSRTYNRKRVTDGD